MTEENEISKVQQNEVNSNPTPIKKRFEKFKPVLNIDKIAPSAPVNPAPQVNNKYSHKM